MSQRHQNQYVVGRKDGEFCWLFPAVEGNQADDQHLELARRFDSLGEAMKASEGHNASVFEVSTEDGIEALRELLVDLKLVESLPFDGCYWVTELLVAGPTFLAHSQSTTRHRILALKPGVRVIVSLVSRTELFWMQEHLDPLHLDLLFHQHHFPVPDGQAPSTAQMRVILDVIDRSIAANRKVFVHCVGGRGRTGTVIGCWLARHGIATGRAALDELVRLRYVCGVFSPSPETDVQRKRVAGWIEDGSAR